MLPATSISFVWTTNHLYRSHSHYYNYSCRLYHPKVALNQPHYKMTNFPYDHAWLQYGSSSSLLLKEEKHQPQNEGKTAICHTSLHRYCFDFADTRHANHACPFVRLDRCSTKAMFLGHRSRSWRRRALLLRRIRQGAMASIAVVISNGITTRT